MQRQRSGKHQPPNGFKELPGVEGRSAREKIHKAKKRGIEAGSGALDLHIKVLQINVDRTRAAHDLLEVTTKDHDIDLIIMSEPNRKIAQDQEWVTDRRGDATIVPVNRGIHIKVVAQGNGFIASSLSGLTVYSCYFSPNYTFEEFEKDVNELFDSIKSQFGDILVAGDFNAASNVWSAKTENARGRLILELLASSDMVLMNVGRAPTFQRGTKNSTPDITFVSSGLAQKIVDWKVLEEDSMSGHRYIKFHVLKNEIKPPTQRPTGWRLHKLNQSELESVLMAQEMNTPEELVKGTTRACDRAMPRKGIRWKAPVYWWNVNIKEKREICTKYRRNYTRKRRKMRKEDSKTKEKEGIQIS